MRKPKRGKVPPKKDKTKKRSAARTNGSGRHAGPRSQTLPGLKKVRIQALDNHCESIGEIRQQQAALRADEQSHLQAALRIMSTTRPKAIDTYKHAKIELLRSPGEVKIRARLLRETVEQDQEGGPIDVDDSIDNGAEEATDDATHDV